MAERGSVSPIPTLEKSSASPFKKSTLPDFTTSNTSSRRFGDARRSTYRYRLPTDGKWFQFGTDRIRAIDAAKQLNLEFMRGADLVGSVLNNASETFASFLEIYERDVLPTRELAKGTMGLCAVHFRRFRKQF